MSYSKPAFEVAGIIRDYQEPLIKNGKLTAQQKKVFTNLSRCRTAALGYHVDKCDNLECNHVKISYNSCRDRHCPKCNGLKREKWVRMREEDLLPEKYYHVVFTVPECLNSLFLQYSATCFDILFKCAWETIKKFGFDHKYLGAKMGMVSILHTWGQNLAFHPHVHCIVPAGGITKNGKWRTVCKNGKYLFPVKALSKVFRGKFSDELIKLDKKKQIELDEKFDANKKYLHSYYKKNWVVYAKLPMHNSRQVVNYIGRYSHRIAISNHRIKEVKDGKVTFSYFNYRTAKVGEIILTAVAFLKCFSLHVLPAGYMKIRHYGILSSRAKAKALECARLALEAEAPRSIKNLPWQEVFFIVHGREASRCPVCKNGKMEVIFSKLPKPRGSPRTILPANKNFYMQ